MIERSAKLLKQAYPIPSEGKIPWKTAIGFGIFVGLFLWTLQPFGLGAFELVNKSLFIWGYGIITAFLMIFNVVLIRGSFPRFYREKSWTVGREIVWSLWNVISIALANWIYSIYWVGASWQTGNLVFFLLVTLGVGGFPIVLLVLINANRLLKKHLSEAQALQANSPSFEPKLKLDSPAELLLLKGENQKEAIKLKPESLLYIRSADNYVEIYFESEAKMNKKLLRSSLSRIDQQLEGQPHLMRCHRAYIINLLSVKDFKGDSQGYKLSFAGLEDEIPVSRRYTKIFRETYQSLNQP